jgi:uncharacterized protein affecting Mg2+/Co2+ transport
MSDTTTRGIRIQVESIYVEERSDPQENYYFFAYHVVISNVGAEPAQLISREWVITDSDGWRVVRVHQFLPTADVDGLDAGLLHHEAVCR